MPKAIARKPRVGLALGSGAARGWAHIGVIRALNEYGIRPEIVTGSSIGAVVGAAYAAGKLDEFEEWALGLDRAGVLHLIDTRLSGGGLMQGATLMKAFERRIGNPNIEDLDIRFGCVATQYGTGREVWIEEGRLMNAVRASIALPGLLSAVEQDGEYLFDGGLVNPVPVSLTRAMGADIVIAVNLNGDLVGNEFFQRDHMPQPTEMEIKEPQAKEFELEFDDEDSIIDKWTEKIKLSIALKVDNYLSSALNSDSEGPGLVDTIIGAVDIMQDRITRARMAGEPPDVHIIPRLRHIGVLNFERAEEAIAGGREAVQRENPELSALKEALARLDESAERQKKSEDK